MNLLASPFLASTFEGLPPKPVELYNFGGFFAITNSMVVTWITALAVIIGVRVAMRNPKLIPSGAQNFVEWIVEVLAGMLLPVLGWDLLKRTFWFFGTVFIFIVSANLISLVPLVGSMGYGEYGPDGNFHVTSSFLRGANADLNMTAAMALVFFALWIYWSITEIGVGGVVVHLFGSKAKSTNVGAILFFGVIFFLVGIIEIISIAFRPVSLMFRLYGNIFGGENLLEAMFHLAGNWAFIALVPFYLFELMVAVVQALVFCLLTATFTGIMCKHEEGHDAHENDHGAASEIAAEAAEVEAGLAHAKKSH